MEFELFKDLERIEDTKNPFCGRYKLDDCEFIIEPNYYTQLLGMQAHHGDKINLIIEAMYKTVRANKKVIFTADYEFPACYEEGFIYREIEDITDPLLIFVEDKSRGSDYGD